MHHGNSYSGNDVTGPLEILCTSIIRYFKHAASERLYGTSDVLPCSSSKTKFPMCMPTYLVLELPCDDLVENLVCDVMSPHQMPN